jgi:hypothetical protein
MTNHAMALRAVLQSHASTATAQTLYSEVAATGSTAPIVKLLAFLALVAEQFFSLRVHQNDLALLVHDYHRIGSRLCVEPEIRS